jgi:hypothetical protein
MGKTGSPTMLVLEIVGRGILGDDRRKEGLNDSGSK